MYQRGITARLMLGFVLWLLLLPFLAYAGSKSHGCKAVVCTDKNGKVSVEVLEHLEGWFLWKLKYNLGDPSINEMDKVMMVLNRLEELDPARAQAYTIKAQLFYENAAFFPNVVLGEISDLGMTLIPKNCRLEQAVIQREPELPGDRLYTISEDLWDLMDNDNKAMLILHEIILEEAIKKGHETSRKTRYFNAHLNSQRFSTMSSAEYLELLWIVSLETDLKFFSISTPNGNFQTLF